MIDRGWGDEGNEAEKEMNKLVWMVRKERKRKKERKMCDLSCLVNNLSGCFPNYSIDCLIAQIKNNYLPCSLIASPYLLIYNLKK